MCIYINICKIYSKHLNLLAIFLNYLKTERKKKPRNKWEFIHLLGSYWATLNSVSCTIPGNEVIKTRHSLCSQGALKLGREAEMQTRHCKAVSASRAEVHVKHHGNMNRGHTSSAWRHDHRKLHRKGNIPAGKMTGPPKEEWQREFQADLHKHKSMKWNNTTNWKNLEQVREGADADTQGQGAEQQDGGRRGTGARAPLTSPEHLRCHPDRWEAAEGL